MPKARPISIKWPMAGLDRSRAYCAQPPYTTPDAVNVRPFEVSEGRMRGGSRPGLKKAFTTDLNSTLASKRIVLLDDVSSVPDSSSPGSSARYWRDDFDNPTTSMDTSEWVAWGTMPGVIVDTTDAVTEKETVKALNLVVDLDCDEQFTVNMYINPYGGVHNGHYYIYLGLARTSGSVGTPIIADLLLTGSTGAYSGSLTSGEDVYAFTGGSTGSAAAGVFQVSVNEHYATITWAGNSLLTSTDFGSTSYTKWGFGMKCTHAGGRCLCDYIEASYYLTSASTSAWRERMLVASADGYFFRELTAGSLKKLTNTSVDIADDRRILSAEYGGKLYIADYEDTVKYGNGASLAANAVTLALGTHTSTGSADGDNDVVVISNGTGNVTDGTYRFTGTSSPLTLTSGAGGAGNCSFRVERAAKVYDPGADELSVWTATDGQVPAGCPLIAVFMDCVVLAGWEYNRRVWYMSRQGDALDWDYAEEDAQAAVAGTSTDAGQPADAITALMPLGDDYLIFGCERSLWRLTGHPGFGGRIDNISREIGVIDKTAFCYTPEGHLVFLSRDGLYVLQDGAGTPQSVGRELLPRELIDIDTDTYEVSLGYDVRDRGIHIYVTDVS